jgi:hypothetical protein
MIEHPYFRRQRDVAASKQQLCLQAPDTSVSLNSIQPATCLTAETKVAGTVAINEGFYVHVRVNFVRNCCEMYCCSSAVHDMFCDAGWVPAGVQMLQVHQVIIKRLISFLLE